jgi:hypothetical protein
VGAEATAAQVQAQAIADALHGVENAASLTVLIERVRAALEAIQDQLSRRSDGEGPAWESGVGAMVFVARGADCAFIFAGPAQAIRCRGSKAAAIVGVGRDWDDADLALSRESLVHAAVHSDVELIDLVTGRLTAAIEPRVEIDVRYESLSSGERWLISGVPLFSEADLNRVASAVATADIGTADVGAVNALEAVRAACGSTAGGPLPVLLLGVAQE